MIFDLDDTLIVEGEKARASFRQAAMQAPGMDAEELASAARASAGELWRASSHLEMGRALGIASWEAMWADFAGGHPCLDEVREWAPGFRLAAWTRALEACGGDLSLAPALAQAYIDAQRAGHAEIPGAAGLVRTLKARNLPVAILTNGPPDIQRLKLAQLGLDECFAAVFISGEVGIGKPDPEIFRLVLEALGAGPEEAVMIGDSWNRDIEGAAGVGMRSIWVSSGRVAPGELTGVTIVDTTSEAGPVLGC